ncbi:MAG: hypothetical protein JNN09_00905 [Alphaproteobacteria bacterium]|nr:hypothetical protein [Alphaproteobacteria bacterium]
MSQSNQSPSERMLWVVFSDETDLPFLKCLRRGFRHCFVVIRDRGHWISYDPLAHYTELFWVDVPETFDLLGWLSEQGMTVIKVPSSLCPKQKILPPMMFTCVEAVKRMIGLRGWWILTPWQLYAALAKRI